MGVDGEAGDSFIYIKRGGEDVCLLVRTVVSLHNRYDNRTIYDTSRGPEEGRYVLFWEEQMHQSVAY